MADNLTQAKESMSALSESIHEAHGEASRFGTIFGSILGSLVSADIARSSARILMEHSMTGRRILRIWEDVQRSSSQVKDDLQEAQANVDYPYTTEEAKEPFRARIAHLSQVLEIQAILTTLDKRAMAAAGALIGYYQQTSRLNAQLQQNLIEANSSFQYRHKLMADTLRVVQRTGLGFAEVTQAARALVGYGMDTQTTWTRNLDLVTRLEHGIGLSVDQSARLAAITENHLKVDFKILADTMAGLVNFTALSAAEAGRLAERVTEIVGVLRPGLGADVGGVTRVLGEYESAFKRLGGSTGQVSELVDRLTTIQGMPAAGLLGVYNPEFAANARDVESVLRSVGRTVQQFTGSMGGYMRQQQLELLSQHLGLGVRELARFVKLESAVAATRSEQIDIEQRFSEQMAATNQGWGRLMRSLTATLQEALLPAVTVINATINTLADAVIGLNRLFQESTVGIWALRAALVAASGAIVAKLASPLLALAAKLGIGAGVKGAAAGLASFFPLMTAIVGPIAGPLILIVGALGALTLAIHTYTKWRKLVADREEAHRHEMQLKDRMQATRVQIIERVAVSGYSPEVAQPVKQALFGVGPTDPGLVGEYMAKFKLTETDALEKIWREHVEPMAALRRAAMAAERSALDTEDPPALKLHKESLDAMRRMAEQESLEQRKTNRDLLRIQAEKQRRDLMRDMTEDPKMKQLERLLRPTHPLYQ